MITGVKSIKFSGMKVTPSKPNDAQLAKINVFTRRLFTVDEMYIGQLRLAHNAIDRDGERFSEEVLNGFAATAVRKTMLFDHDKYNLKESAVGKFFDIEIEKMSLDQARQVLGEDLVLPPGIVEVMIVSPWYYIPVDGVEKETLVKIDASIYDFASIGFSAENCVPIFDEQGNVLFYEYRGKGETREGSLVYLGAQQGMATKGYHEKGAVSFSADTPAYESRPWDAAAATARLAKWASSDGSGDKDKVDWARYRKGFAWFDSSNPKDFGSYKLPHHDVINPVRINTSEICVVWSGVSAAMGALLGARGGVAIPETDKEAVYVHLSKHYKQWSKEPPAKVAHFEDTNSEGGSKPMEKFLKILARLFPGKSFTEDGLTDEMKAALDEYAGKHAKAEVDKAVKPLTDKIAELTPLAADGKAYRDELISQYVANKAKLKEVAETPEAQDTVKAVAATYPIEFLKNEVKRLQARVEEKFPHDPNLKGDDRQDKSGDGVDEKDWKKENPLVPKDEKKEGN